MSSEQKYLRVFTVDSFSKTPFGGNPAAVCLVDNDEDISDKLMQSIAAEMNISETAFIQKLKAQDSFIKGSRFGLRWFSPTIEVPLCGHATLASAAVLFYCLGNQSDKITFETRSADLHACRQGDYISLDLPLSDLIQENLDDYRELLEVIGTPEVEGIWFSKMREKLLVRLKDSTDRQIFESLAPDTKRLMEVEKTGKVRGVIISVKGGNDPRGYIDDQGHAYDFVSRYFAPWSGIPEDPVTGSAHTVLAAYWSKELQKKEMYARQCSKRGGELQIKVGTDGRVDVAGKATIVLEGKLYI